MEKLFQEFLMKNQSRGIYPVEQIIILGEPEVYKDLFCFVLSFKNQVYCQLKGSF